MHRSDGPVDRGQRLERPAVDLDTRQEVTLPTRSATAWLGVRLTVAVLFLGLGASFVVSTAAVMQEFRHAGWLEIVLGHSHVLFFFPVFGLLVLAAFFVPTALLAYVYWVHIPFGKVRLLMGVVALAMLSYALALWMDRPPRWFWEASPRALALDRGSPNGCGQEGKPACLRAPLASTFSKLRAVAQTRTDLHQLARACIINPLTRPVDQHVRRYCFPADSDLDTPGCCRAQAGFSNALAKLHADPANRSRSGTLEALLLPGKVFFVALILIVGVLLATRREATTHLCPEWTSAMDRGVVIGALAMLVWPLMDYAYQQTANLLFGGGTSGLQMRISLFVAPWTVLMLSCFLQYHGRALEALGQFAFVAITLAGVAFYDQSYMWATRSLGIGADYWVVASLIALAVLGGVLLLWPRLSSTPPDASRLPART